MGLIQSGSTFEDIAFVRMYLNVINVIYSSQKRINRVSIDHYLSPQGMFRRPLRGQPRSIEHITHVVEHLQEVSVFAVQKTLEHPPHSGRVLGE